MSLVCFHSPGTVVLGARRLKLIIVYREKCEKLNTEGKTPRTVPSRHSGSQLASRCRESLFFLYRSLTIVSPVSTQSPRFSCAVDYPFILFLGSMSSSPSLLFHRLEVRTCIIPSTLCTSRHLSSTELPPRGRHPRRKLPMRGIFRLYLVSSVPGTPEATTPQLSPSFSPLPRSWSVY